LQTVLIAAGFYPLATEEVVGGHKSEVYGEVDFCNPLHVYEPLMGGRRFANPAVSISSVEVGLRLVFGSLVPTESGWKITNHEHLLSQADLLIKPSPVTYFKPQ
jgi:hypothetical protein